MGNTELDKCKHESMDPSSLVSTVDGVIVGGGVHLHVGGYLVIVVDPVHPFMTSVQSCSDACFTKVRTNFW